MRKIKCKLITLLLLVLCTSVFSQVYYKKIKMVSDQFTSPLPRGYMVRVYGPIEDNVNFLKLTITIDGISEYYYWKRANNFQTEFELLITKPIKSGVKFTYVVQKGTENIGTKLTELDLYKSDKKLLDESTNEGTPEEVNTSSRWGLVSGFGCVFLSRKEARSQDMFGYVAAKFMFSKNVDKSKKNLVDPETGLKNRVYKTALDRFSVMVGGAVTPIGYRGKELTSPVYGVKPMVGLSFDFSPEISIDGGALFYKYQPGNASLNNTLDSKLGVGLYMSVSVDFDVFTRMKSAFAGVPYVKTEK